MYCQIPFAQTKANNPEVIQLAHKLGRTPASVARKLGNFGAFDGTLAQRGIKGLTHVSRADAAIWAEFSGDWARLVNEAQYVTGEDAADEIATPVAVRTETTRPVSVRLCQSFFRRAVLVSYDTSCCLCGLDFPELLVASHIVPWSVSEVGRADPRNGLCLCSLHDRAFDCGLLTIDSTNLAAKVALHVLASTNPAIVTGLAAFQDRRICLPERFPPNPEYLRWHEHNIYRG